jgi:Cys-Gly metallodipeptidase DUG1
MAPQLDSYFKQVDTLTDHFIDRLRKAVAIPSVSADDERRPDVVKVSFVSTVRIFKRLSN